MKSFDQIVEECSAKTYDFHAGFLVSYQLGSKNSAFLSVHTIGVGMEGKNEIRRPGLLNVPAVHAHFENMGYTLNCVSRSEELASFLRTGGHTVIERSLMELHWNELLEAKLVARVRKYDFGTYSLVEDRHLKRFASGTYRIQILERDGYRCAVCGSSPDDNIHVRLEVHHVKPWEEGGLTIPENLITLCKVCHDGIKTADREILYKKVGLRIDRSKGNIYPANPKWSREQFTSYSSLLSNSVAFEIKLPKANILKVDL